MAKITQIINYCLDLSCLHPFQRDEILVLYNRLSKIFPRQFTFIPPIKDSTVFFVAFSYGGLKDNYVGYSSGSPAAIKAGDKTVTFVSYSSMVTFINKYIKNNKSKSYSKNIKITLELVKHI